MPVIEGVVGKVGYNEITARRGKMRDKQIKLYYIAMDDNYYRCGWKNPKEQGVDDGDVVKLQYTKDTNGNLNVEMTQDKKLKAKVVGKGEPKQQPNYKKGIANTQSGTDWVAKDRMVSYQAAMNTSLALVTSAVANGLIKFTGRSGDVKYDAFKEAVFKQAVELYQMYQRVPEEYDVIMSMGQQTEAEDVEEPEDEPLPEEEQLDLDFDPDSDEDWD